MKGIKNYSSFFYLYISKIVSQKTTPLQTSKALETTELFLFKKQQINQFS